MDTSPFADMGDQVFAYRDPKSTNLVVRVLGWVSIALVLAMPPVLFGTLVSRTEGGWPLLWQAMSKAPSDWLLILLHWLALLAVVVLMVLWAPKGRLILSSDRLTYRSDLPLLNRWLDWTEPLDTLRAAPWKWEFRRPDLARSRLFPAGHIAWRKAWWRVIRFNPEYWLPMSSPNSPHLSTQTPLRGWRRFLKLRAPAASASEVAARLMATPLVQALRARQIPVPDIPVERRSGSVWQLDLMQHPRLRRGVWTVVLMLALGAAGAMGAAMERFFESPDEWMLIAVGAVVGVIAACTVWPKAEASGGSSRQSARAMVWTTLGLSALIGVVTAFCLPQIGLAWVKMTQAPQSAVFALQTVAGDTHIVASSSQLPAIRSPSAIQEWEALPGGTTVVLPVRRGPGGLWWQYDAEPVAERLNALRKWPVLSK